MPVLHPREEGARLLLANEHAEVYATYETGIEGGREHELEIRGCAYGQKSHKAGDASGGTGSGGGGTSRLVLAGAIFAGEESSYCTVCPEFTEGHSVFAIDLRTGTKLVGATSPASVGSMVVKTDGALAWIASRQISETGIHEQWVYAHDRAGTRLLAHGSNIDDSSLAIAGSTIYWAQGGQPFSAALK